jgi:hypothetical protein
LSAKERKIEGFHVEMWPIDKPIDYPQNARKWSPKAVEKVATSIREFGWRQPVVVDSQGVIVIGHLRRAAGKSIGLTECPVHVAADLSPAKVRALRLADNRTAQEAEWDLDILASEFADLKTFDFDLSITGFEPYEWMRGDGVTPAWAGMPEFRQDEQITGKTILVHFQEDSDRDKFSQLIDQPISAKTKYLWFPPRIPPTKAIYSGPDCSPRYPIYIISKGRAESRLTSRALESMNVSYRIVVEPQEYEQYASVIDHAKILQLPFSNLGQGSIPARNWVWDHAISEGHARHWILDDNIKGFVRLHENEKHRITSGVVFRAVEDFTDRYLNVALSGMQYSNLTPRTNKRAPIILNTRIYSCILVANETNLRWRGRYNEDTDLSLRVLKKGLCTILFNSLQCEKTATMVMKGGNTDDLYQGDGRLKMAQSLQEQHPDVVKITKKWGRWQHQVDYRPFKANKFIPRPGFVEPTESDDYGMVLEELDKQEAASAD